jgi:hypothetical protein
MAREEKMNGLLEIVKQELDDVRDLRERSKSAKENHIRGMLWGAATITIAFLSYSALRLYFLGQVLGVEIVAGLGLFLMVPMFGILYLLGPIRERRAQVIELRGVRHDSERQHRAQINF